MLIELEIMYQESKKTPEQKEIEQLEEILSTEWRNFKLNRLAQKIKLEHYRPSTKMSNY